MFKQRNRRVSRKPIYLVLAFSLLVAICFGLYKTYFSPAPAPIFLINPAQLEYGQTTISGIIQKDVPAGKKGTFLLVLSDSRPVLLDVQGIDNLIGLKVSVTGTLSPSPDSFSPMSMVVQKITVTE